MDNDELTARIQTLDSKYAALARSQYDFGAGTAKRPVTSAERVEIQARMAEVAAEIDRLRGQRHVAT